MTQEEKARAYDEALERAKSFQQKFGGDYAGYIFPELRESPEEAADKHIRKVADVAGHPGWDWTTQDISEAFIAGAKWQKEQKPADFPTTDEEVNEFLETHPKVEVPEKYKTPDFVFSKQEYESHPIISKDTTSVRPAEWSEKDEALLKEIIAFFKDGTVKLQHDLDLYASFLEHRLKSLRPQPKREWSEEDVAMIKRVIERIEAEIQYGDALTMAYGNQEIAWLKSLHPSWKPSEEQMMKDAVEGRIHTIGFHNAIYIKEPEWSEKLDKYEEGDKVLVSLLPMEDEK